MSEAEAATSLYVGESSIKDLTGLQAFKALKYFNCSNNSISSIDLSKNTELSFLICDRNSLKNLDVSQNTNLTYLNCSSNQLANIDISKNIALVGFNCSVNKLANIDVSKNINLELLGCTNNELDNLDISNNLDLLALSFAKNKLTSIDLNKNTLLKGITCFENQLTSLDVRNNNNLVKERDSIVFEYQDLNGGGAKTIYRIVGIRCTQNPNLNQICININQASDTSSWYKDPLASWSTTCITGIEDEFLKPVNKRLIKIYTVFGQTVKTEELQEGRVYIYQYSDGSTKKIIRQD